MHFVFVPVSFGSKSIRSFVHDKSGHGQIFDRVNMPASVYRMPRDGVVHIRELFNKEYCGSINLAQEFNHSRTLTGGRLVPVVDC